MIKNYFALQYKMLNRQLADFGVPAAAAWIVLPAVFIGLSFYLFHKTAFARYIYILMAVSLTVNFTSSDRNNFLRSCFKQGDYYRVRLGENILVVLPFLIFLICKNCVASAGILLALATATAFISFKSKLQFIIPTPFYKKPFEFIAGFRKMWPALLCCYLFTIMAIVVHNFNLGVVALTAIFLLCISFYQEMETGFYVWVYSLTPHQFLKQKIATAAWQASLLTLPAAIALGICYPPHLNIIGLFFCLGHIYLATAICAKYSAFPQPVELPQVILLVAGILFAPLLILIIPYFYIRSLKKLNNLLR
ncbi:hypothetical protein QWZ08_01830 [Ferruginibacter paludis]|uniref:hypothetical protein n=1 Tax=Ferruginibacter paludis TaxID=1310417 RepID=UPI0025B55EDC|nr:hypothetical protein [Ferruginibacter paludis]MDN3654345.1 hypothetical protein [Ferruginibacter paludis]